MCVRAHVGVCVRACSRVRVGTAATWKSVPLPLSGRWAAGRSGRWVLGAQTREIESHREWLSERVSESSAALSVSTAFLRTAAVFRPCRSVFILPNTHLHLHQQHRHHQRPGSLHFFLFFFFFWKKGPEQRSPRTPRAAPCPQTALLWMRWGIKAGEEEEGGRTEVCLFFFFFFLAESSGRTGTGEWSLDRRQHATNALYAKKPQNTFCPELLL